MTGVRLHSFLDGQNGRGDDLVERLLVDRTLDGNVREVGVDFRIRRRANGGVVGRVFVVLSYRTEDEGEVADAVSRKPGASGSQPDLASDFDRWVTPSISNTVFLYLSRVIFDVYAHIS